MSAPTFAGARVLVTGASGFLGSHLCDRLLCSGAEVHATSRVRQPRTDQGLRWWQSDLQNPDAVLQIVQQIAPEIIFHLAGQVTAAPDMALVEPTFQSLLGSTVHMLVAATKVGCRRVITTGSLTEPEPHQPNAVPSSPYAAAKWSASAYARMFHQVYGTPVVILRPFMTYGPKQHPTKIVPYVIRSLLEGSAPTISSGQWKADWIFVDDVIEGFMRAGLRPAIDGSTIDLGSGVLTSIHDVVRQLVGLIDPRIDPQFGAIPDRPAEQVRHADIASAQLAIDWSPITSLKQGLVATVDWHRSQFVLSRKELAS